MSDNFSLIIKNGSCYINGKLTKTDIGLSGGKIKKIGKIELNSSKVYDATDKVVLPGIIDTQVHFREPGSTNAEDLESGSRAAVLGGVTSLFEMPNTNPPTANLIEFDKKLKAAKKTSNISGVKTKLRCQPNARLAMANSATAAQILSFCRWCFSPSTITGTINTKPPPNRAK